MRVSLVAVARVIADRVRPKEGGDPDSEDGQLDSLRKNKAG